MPEARPRISAIICTNRPGPELYSALESLSRQTLRVDDYEVIVVVNASGEPAESLIAGLSQRFPSVRAIKEAGLGLSIARNAGARSAVGDFVAYLDDDARADDGWLEALLDAFGEMEPSPAAVGGRVQLDWGGDAPTWLPFELWSLYSHLDQGENPHSLATDEYLVGTNMAFRRATLLELGGFAVYLGRRGTQLLSGEEAELLSRMQAWGLTVVYEPKAIVTHVVPPPRQKPSWLRSRMFWDGASQPLLDFGLDRSRSFYLERSLRDLKRLIGLASQFVIHRGRGDRTTALLRALQVIQKAGRLRTELRLALRGGA